eukprot:jgi/Astpho2/4170/Aster-05137
MDGSNWTDMCLREGEIQLLVGGYASEEWPEFDDPRLKKVGSATHVHLRRFCSSILHVLQFVIITLLGGWTSKEGLWQTRLARHLADTLDLSLLAIDVTGRDWRWKEFQKQGLVQDPAHPVSAKLVNWRLTREGFEEISAVDLRKEAISIPEETHLYWLSAQDRLHLEIDELNDTGAFNHIPAYQSIELKGENHHFVNNVSNFFSVMEATMRKELAQAEFLKNFIGKAGPTQQYSCPAKTQTGSIHRRLSGTVMPNRLFFGPHFPSDGAQGLVKPAAIYDPDRGWLTTVVHMTSFADLCSTQLCRTWQRAVVGYLGPTGSALPQPPSVKGAVAFEFESSSYSQTIENLHAAKHGGISFTSYRPFVFQREPYVAYAMAIYDTSLNLTVDSPNSHKQRIEVTGIARMNIRSKQPSSLQLLSVYDFKEPLVPRRERLSCDTNWGFLELPPAVDMPPQLHILYTILPCLTVFTFNASASTGADFRSARCLTSIHSTLVQQETGLDMQNVRISGHPIVTWRQSDGQPSELMVLVHHSWRKHGGAAHWAVTVDPKTWQVTQVSLKPVLTYESFHLYNEFVNNSIAVGSYHLEGKTLRILFGDGDKYASWEDVDTATIQFLSLDRADGSPAIFTNDYTLVQHCQELKPPPYAQQYEQKMAITAYANWIIPSHTMLDRYSYIEPSKSQPEPPPVYARPVFVPPDLVHWDDLLSSFHRMWWSPLVAWSFAVVLQGLHVSGHARNVKCEAFAYIAAEQDSLTDRHLLPVTQDFDGQQNCTQGAPSRHAAQALPEHRRSLAVNRLKTAKADPKRLIWRPPFTTDGSQGLVNPASTFDPNRGWITTVVHIATHRYDANTQGGRTWQKVVVGFSGPSRSAMPHVPHVKGAISLAFEPSSFARTVRRTHASEEGGISFNSYRPFMMDGEPHVSYAMAIFDASLNLTNASPNDQKMRVQTTGIGRLNIKSKQLVSVFEFLEPLIPRREPLCCDKNWGLLELPTGRGEEQELHIFYTMVPCLTIFAYNPRIPLGADFRSARCLSPAYSNLVQKKTGLDMHDVRLSGHPVVSRRREGNQPSELLFLVHHSWRQHGGAAHWVVLVNIETWQITHISIKPVLHYEQFNLYNEFVTNVIAVGSYHLDGNLMRVFFGDGDKFASYADLDTRFIAYFALDSSESVLVAQNNVMLGDRLVKGKNQKGRGSPVVSVNKLGCVFDMADEVSSPMGTHTSSAGTHAPSRAPAEDSLDGSHSAGGRHEATPYEGSADTRNASTHGNNDDESDQGQSQQDIGLQGGGGFGAGGSQYTVQDFKKNPKDTGRTLMEDLKNTDPESRQQLMGQALREVESLLGRGKLWEDYVGQVEMATAIAAFKAEQGDDPKPTAPGIGDRKEMKKLQETRETALAEVLKGKIAQYVGGDKAGFRAGMEQEAVRLASMPFGNAMLDHIGTAYEHAAQPVAGTSLTKWVRRKAHRAQFKGQAAVGGVSLYMMKSHYKEFAQHGAKGLAEAIEYFEDHLGRNVSGLWRINVYDVETTIKGVVNKVLAKDAHSDKTKRQTAAHAIMEMGQIFQDVEEQDIRAGSAIGLTPELEGQIKQGASQAQGALGQAGGQAQQQSGQGLEQGGREAAKRAGPGAEKAEQQAIRPAADKVAENAEPMAGRATDTLNQGAQKFSEQAQPTAERMKQEQVMPAAQKLADNAEPLAEKLIQEVIQPAAKKIEQEGRPRAQQLAEQYAKPMGDNASNADQAADQMVEEKLKPAAQDLSNQMQPAADQFSEEQLKPMAAKVADGAPKVAAKLNQEQLQPRADYLADHFEEKARAFAKRLGPLAAGLPDSIEKAVKKNKVPDELKRDLLLIASKLRPIAQNLVQAADQLYEQAPQIQAQIKPTAEKLGSQLESGAQQVSEQAMPMADKAAGTLHDTAGQAAEQVPSLADNAGSQIKRGGQSMQAYAAASLVCCVWVYVVTVVLVRVAEEAPEGDEAHQRVTNMADNVVDQVQPRADQLSAAIRGAATAVKEKGVPAAESNFTLVLDAAQAVSDVGIDKTGQAAERAPDYADKASGQIQSGARQAKEQAGPMADKASEQVHAGAGKVQERGPELGDQASQQTQRGMGQATQGAQQGVGKAQDASLDSTRSGQQGGGLGTQQGSGYGSQQGSGYEGSGYGSQQGGGYGSQQGGGYGSQQGGGYEGGLGGTGSGAGGLGASSGGYEGSQGDYGSKRGQVKEQAQGTKDQAQGAYAGAKEELQPTAERGQQKTYETAGVVQDKAKSAGNTVAANFSKLGDKIREDDEDDTPTEDKAHDKVAGFLDRVANEAGPKADQAIDNAKGQARGLTERAQASEGDSMPERMANKAKDKSSGAADEASNRLGPKADAATDKARNVASNTQSGAQQSSGNSGY